MAITTRKQKGHSSLMSAACRSNQPLTLTKDLPSGLQTTYEMWALMLQVENREIPRRCWGFLHDEHLDCSALTAQLKFAMPFLARCVEPRTTWNCGQELGCCSTKAKREVMLSENVFFPPASPAGQKLLQSVKPARSPFPWMQQLLCRGASHFSSSTQLSKSHFNCTLVF